MVLFFLHFQSRGELGPHTLAERKIMDFSLTNLTGAVTAIGALGTAAFGLVDATKLVRGGVSSSGFCFIQTVVEILAPDADPKPNDISATSQKAIQAAARANWLNGMALPDQKSALKALIKLRLNPDTAPNLANLMGVDPEVLKTVAIKLAGGDPDPDSDAPAAAGPAPLT